MPKKSGMFNRRSSESKGGENKQEPLPLLHQKFIVKFYGKIVVDKPTGNAVCEGSAALIRARLLQHKGEKDRVRIDISSNSILVSDRKSNILYRYKLTDITFVWADPIEDTNFGLIARQPSLGINTFVFYYYKMKPNENETKEDPVVENKPTTPPPPPKVVEDLLCLNDLYGGPHSKPAFNFTSPVKKPSLVSSPWPDMSPMTEELCSRTNENKEAARRASCNWIRFDDTSGSTQKTTTTATKRPTVRFLTNPPITPAKSAEGQMLFESPGPMMSPVSFSTNPSITSAQPTGGQMVFESSGPMMSPVSFSTTPSITSAQPTGGQMLFESPGPMMSPVSFSTTPAITSAQPTGGQMLFGSLGPMVAPAPFNGSYQGNSPFGTSQYSFTNSWSQPMVPINQTSPTMAYNWMPGAV